VTTIDDIEEDLAKTRGQVKHGLYAAPPSNQGAT
jgi:hypothetical protein